MATSTVQICNNALIKLGSDTITSLSDNTKPARLCNKMYEIVRDELLRTHPWNFAIEREQLAQISTNPDFGYSYQYQLPADCLRVLKISDTSVEYRIEGRKLLTDANAVKLVYIKKVTDVAQFDSAFSDLLALKLAAELSYSLTDNASLTGTLSELFERRFRRAKMIDAQEDSIYVLETDTFTSGRFTGAVEGITFESSTS